MSKPNPKPRSPKLPARTPKTGGAPQLPDDAKVGYRSPPKGTRWAPGQSGNPSGRPRKVPTAMEMLDEELDRYIVLQEPGGKKRRTNETYRRRTIRRFVADAARGEPRQQTLMLTLMIQSDALRGATGKGQNPDHRAPTVDERAAHAMMDHYLVALVEGRALLMPPSPWDPPS
jgi:hypothetical protein